MPNHRRTRLALAAAVLAALTALPHAARAQSSAYSLSDIVELVRNKVPSKRVLSLAKQNCVSFAIDDDARTKLKRAGAAASLITGLESVCGPDHPKPNADSVAAAAAPAPAPAPPPPVDTTFPVTIRAAVVGQDLTVRPVPQMDLYIISPKGDTTRTSTDLEGAAQGSFKEGVYRIESAHSVTIGTARYRWAFYQSFAKDMRAIELTQKNAMIDSIAAPSPAPTTTASTTGDSSARPAADSTASHAAADSASRTPAAPQRKVYTERELFGTYRSGVFSVFGATRATGFLADSAGLVVTNAHVIKGAAEVRVQIDSVTKVMARPLIADDAKDVAILAINMDRCGACTVLPLFDTSKSAAPAAGDRVLAMGSPLKISSAS